MNWAAIAAIGGLLSGLGAVTTAATGLWHPSVPEISIKWVPIQQLSESSSAAPAQVQVTAQAPLPTPSPTRATGGNYQANWSTGIDGWTGSAEWKSVPGMLLSDGSKATYGPPAGANGDDSAVPPYHPSTSNYAIEARIQVVSHTFGCFFGIHARVQPSGQGSTRMQGYLLGVNGDAGANIGYFTEGSYVTIQATPFNAGTDWHVYRAELSNNELALLIDGKQVLKATDNRLLDAGEVGLASGACQVQVSSFTVVPL